MRVPIPHDLPREEVRRRLSSRSHEIARFIPGGMAQVTTDWPNEAPWPSACAPWAKAFRAAF